MSIFDLTVIDLLADLLLVTLFAAVVVVVIGCFKTDDNGIDAPFCTAVAFNLR